MTPELINEHIEAQIEYMDFLATNGWPHAIELADRLRDDPLARLEVEKYLQELYG